MECRYASGFDDLGGERIWDYKEGRRAPLNDVAKLLNKLICENEQLTARLAELEPEWIPGVPSEKGAYWTTWGNLATGEFDTYEAYVLTSGQMNMSIACRVCLAYMPKVEPAPYQPPKTIEQLQAERNAAADALLNSIDEYHMDATIENAMEVYQYARDAHRAAKRQQK